MMLVAKCLPDRHPKPTDAAPGLLASYKTWAASTAPEQFGAAAESEAEGEEEEIVELDDAALLHKAMEAAAGFCSMTHPFYGPVSGVPAGLEP